MTFSMLLLFLFLQSDSFLSPTVVAIVTAAFTVIVGTVGIAYLKDKVNASTRIQGLIASLVSAYGIVTPFISNFPRGIGTAIAVVGLVVTLFSGRLHGPPDA